MAGAKRLSTAIDVTVGRPEEGLTVKQVFQQSLVTSASESWCEKTSKYSVCHCSQELRAMKCTTKYWAAQLNQRCDDNFSGYSGYCGESRSPEVACSETHYETLIICERYSAEITCHNGTIDVLWANYGRLADFATACPHRLTTDVRNCAQESSFLRVKEACGGRPSCSLVARNEWGDPCPETYKYLEVVYSCRSGDER
ncbi:L-rhamnose-binding lectin CSL1-like [Diadema antillarum]|uniref:L-rhamnose-binding lectin CSL1-like n=1 Tax=Diadema antillarum TaxID=105358 RepID=UPI003A849FF8